MSGLRLAGKVALISGGASGIGAETARRFVQEGARVVVADIQAREAKMLTETLGSETIAVELDVREPASWERAIAAAMDFGPLNILVNSAGVSIPGSIEDITLEDFRHTTAINLDGVFLGCKAGIAAMKGGHGGSIVNVASTLGVRSGAVFPAYSASKGGVRLLTRSVALHCAQKGYNIRVNAVLPGAIHTAMVERYVAAGEAAGQPREAVIAGFASAHPLNRLGQPREAADAIVFLASDESSFTTGADLPVDGGFLA